MRQKPVEILAPAGSYETMKAAIAAGADAVYIGGSRFGARAYAQNPDEGLLLEAIDYAHLYGCKIYMTVNTLIKEKELRELAAYLEPYYLRGIDAVIVQDMGAFAVIREHYPDLPVHASTQMTITGAYGAKMLAALGADRIVTARELSLEEIARIHAESDVEIESFVHGALCYCYSGQCLFSSLIGGRSGNRGRCAQTCRLPFDVVHSNKVMNKKDEKYVLSLKDLCTLDIIPDIIEAGVYSLKIEGRMKSSRYTAGVVSIYRKYVDLYLEKGRGGYCVDDNDRNMLLQLFDRGGFTDGYYRRHNGKSMAVWEEKPAFREGDQELFDYLDQTYVKVQKQIPIEGEVRLIPGEPSVLKLQYGKTTVTVSGEPVQEALSQPVTEQKLRKQIEKTGNTPFLFHSLTILTPGKVFLPVQALNKLRREGLDALEQALVRSCHREKRNLDFDRMPGQIPIKVQGSTHMKLHVSLERYDGFTNALESRDVSRIYLDAAGFLPSEWFDLVSKCHKAGKQCMLMMPHIFRREAEHFFRKYQKEMCNAEFDGVLVRSLEEVEYLRGAGLSFPMVFDYGMYGMNQRAADMMMQLGASELTMPVELNSHELEALGHPGELIVYGRLPMMVTAQCVRQGMEGCSKVSGILGLKDRKGKEFPVKNHCIFCYNTIYNACPVSLLGEEKTVKKIGPGSLRLQFTIESAKEVKEVIEAFTDGFFRGKTVDQPFGDFTRGHFKRGVE